MSRRSPYIVSDEDDDPANSSDELIDLIDDDSDSQYDFDFEITEVRSRDKTPKPSAASCIKRRDLIQRSERELSQYTFSKGCTITPGNTVELRDLRHEGQSLNSGDFLRVKYVIKNVDTGCVYLRGHRLKRTKYLGQLFSWKLNELAMVLRVREGDTRCAFIAGLEDVAVEEVLCTRECVLTNKPYPFLSFRDAGCCSFPASLSKAEIKEQIFDGGLLACRVVQVIFISKNGKPYSGIVRWLHAKEADQTRTASTSANASRTESILLSDEDDSRDSMVRDLSRGISTLGRRARSISVDHGSRKRRSPSMPQKPIQYTFGDAFCGAGGASQGAKQAGYSVIWGMDFNEFAIAAYSANHSGALPFELNAHDFPPKGYPGKKLRVDVLHLSPPCCFFSPANTRRHSKHGSPNDQANLEALFTVGPILKEVKPRVATLEQTFGLSTFREHQKYFLILLNDISNAGYDLRYKLENLSQFGLVQPRKRLLIIAARRGTPLPPFPKPTHGPPGSGLKRFTTIQDVLVPIERLGSRPSDDQYHLPKYLSQPKAPYDPRRFLKGCITTGGGVDWHPSGLRNFTPRELGLFQSFPMTYKFCGSQTEAKRQVGNAFPPIMAEAMFRTIAKTLEAFDKGFIGAEDDIDDIDSILERKGVGLQSPPAPPQAAFRPSPRPSPLPLRSRYLMRDNRHGAAQNPPKYSSPFARNHVNFVRPSRVPASRAQQNVNLLDGLLDDLESSDDVEAVESIETGPSRPSRVRNRAPEIIEISSESDDSSSEEDEEEDEDGDEFSGWIHVRERR